MLGNKTRTLLRNIVEIRRLLWLLFNQDPVSLFLYLHDLRFNNLEEHFSLFTFCDEDTAKKIERLYKLVKDRIYSLSLRRTQVEEEKKQENTWPKTIDQAYLPLNNRHQ